MGSISHHLFCLYNELELEDKKNSNDISEQSIYQKFRSNAFVNTETEEFNLFITASRFNHSCLPNLARDFSVDKHGNTVQRFFAIRDINCGDELEICYNTEDNEFEMSTSERTAFYQENNDFTCCCALCTTKKS